MIRKMQNIGLDESLVCLLWLFLFLSFYSVYVLGAVSWTTGLVSVP